MIKKLILLFILWFLTISGYSQSSNDLTNQAWALIEKEKFVEALKSFEKAIKLDPANGWAYYGAGFVLNFKLKEYRNSISYYEKAQDLIKDKPFILSETALAYDSLKEFDKSLEFFLKSIELSKSLNEKPATWITLNVAAYYLFHLKEKNFKEALIYLDIVINSSEYSAENKDTALDWKSYAYYELKDDQNFVKFAEYYVANGLNAQTVKVKSDYLANYYYKTGDFDKMKFYANIVGADFWITRLTSERLITIKGEIHLRKALGDWYPSIKPNEVAFALPMDTDFQEFISFDSSYNNFKIIKDGKYNIAVFNFGENFPGIWSFTITVRNKMFKFTPKEIKSVTDKNDPLYYYANFGDSYYDFNNPEFQKSVLEIVKDAQTPADKLNKIHNWTSENFVHILEIENLRSETESGRTEFVIDKIPDYKKTSEIFKTKTGHCRHASDLFISMSRAVNIPARLVEGFTIAYDTSINSGGCDQHYTVEVYDAGSDKWFYIEPQDNYFFGINQFWHILLGYEHLKDKYKNMICLLNLGWYEHYNLNYPDCVTFEVKF